LNLKLNIFFLRLAASHRLAASLIVSCLFIVTILPLLLSNGNEGDGKPCLRLKRMWADNQTSDYPSEFDWRGYLQYHSDLRASGIRTGATAWDHYKKTGQQVRKTPQIHILLRYMACQGLFNQMYAHLAAFILAERLGADVVMPPSLYRPVIF
jgi:hypothetical protein